MLGEACVHFADEKTVVTAPESLLKKMLSVDDPDSPLVRRLRNTSMRHDVILCGEVDPVREILDREAANSEDRQAGEYWARCGKGYVGATLTLDFPNVWAARIVPKSRLLTEDENDCRLLGRVEGALLENVPVTGTWTLDVHSLPAIKNEPRPWTERKVIGFVQDYVTRRVLRLRELPWPQDRWLAAAGRATIPQSVWGPPSASIGGAMTREQEHFSALLHRGNSLKDYHAAWVNEKMKQARRRSVGQDLSTYHPREHLVREMLWGEDAFYVNRRVLALALELCSRHRRKARIQSSETPSLSWRVHLLPFLGLEELYKRFDVSQPWDHPQNRKLLAEMPDIYDSPGVSGEGLTTVLLPAGPGTPYERPGQWWVLPVDIGDGLTGTIQFPEADPEAAVPWTKPEDLAYDPQAPTKNLKIDPSTGSFRAVFFGGSLRAVRANQDAATIRAIFTHLGREDISNEVMERDSPALVWPRLRENPTVLRPLVVLESDVHGLPFIPADANAVLVVNVQEILRNWPFPMFPKSGSMVLVKEKTGIDLDKIDQVVLLSSLVPLPGSDDPKTDIGIIVRAREPFEEGAIAAKVAGETESASHAGKDYLRPLDGERPSVSFPERHTVLVAHEPMLKKMLAGPRENNRVVERLRDIDRDHDIFGLVQLDEVREALDAPDEVTPQNWPDHLSKLAGDYDLAIISVDFGGPWLARIVDRDQARQVTMPDEPSMQRNSRAPDFGLVFLKGEGNLIDDEVEHSAYTCSALIRSCRSRLALAVARAGEVPAPLDHWVAEAVVENSLGGMYNVSAPMVGPSADVSTSVAVVFTTARVPRPSPRWQEIVPNGIGEWDLLRFTAPACDEICRTWPHCRKTDRLLRIALAMRMESFKNGHLLHAASQGPNGNPKLSWRVRLLPLLGHAELFQKFHHDEPWDSPHNKSLLPEMPACYLAPGRENDGKTTYVTAAGPGTVFAGESAQMVGPRSGRPSVRTATTIAVVEVTDEQAVPWTAPQDWQHNAEDPIRGLVRNEEGKTFRAGMFDGTVKTIRTDLDANVHCYLLARLKRQRIDFTQVFVDEQ